MNSERIKAPVINAGKHAIKAAKAGTTPESNFFLKNQRQNNGTIKFIKPARKQLRSSISSSLL